MAAETRMKVHHDHFNKSKPPPEGQAVYEQITTSEMNVEGVYTTITPTSCSNEKKEKQRGASYTTSCSDEKKEKQRGASYTTITPTSCSDEKKEKQRGASKKKTLSIMGILVITSLAATACIVCIAVLFIQIATLKSHYNISIATMKLNYDAQLSDQQTKLDLLTYSLLNNSISREAIVENLTKLDLLTDSLLNNSISHEAIVEDLFALQTMTLQLNESLYQLFDQQLKIFSCADLPPSAPPGYYLIRNSSLPVYCDMSRTCGGVTGGWMRVFKLDMNITSHQCPNGLSQRTDGGLRTCVKNVSAAGCSSIFLPTRNVNYSRVCGRITGYQIGTTDNFQLQQSSDIDSVYVDGVSLTHEFNQRQHIWTFAVAVGKSHCPCQLDHAPPSFVGDDYFCDSGTQEHASPGRFYSDPLWNDADCVCCANPPWFHQQLPQPTSDDIEMRVCRNEPNTHEDIATQVVEIYVR